ncbi:hypothetical protein OC834_000149 [Tilletia horrida]|nr:hypothetical protein OC834_000149 [Tilletia horrida]
MSRSKVTLRLVEHGYFPGSGGSPSSILSRSPPQTMLPPPTAALSSFTPSHSHFSAHGRSATTIPPLPAPQGPPRPSHFTGLYSGPPMPTESPSSTGSHSRFGGGPSAPVPGSWQQERSGGRMGPPPPAQAGPSYPPPSSVAQSQSWPNVGGGPVTIGSSRPPPPPSGAAGSSLAPSSAFEAEILSRLNRVETVLQELSQDMHGLLASMGRHPRQDPSFSISPPSTMMHSAERMAGVAAERQAHGASPHPQSAMHPSPRERHETVLADPRSGARTGGPAQPPQLPPPGSSILSGPSPQPSAITRGGHIRPLTAGSAGEDRVQIPPRTSSTMFSSGRASPGLPPPHHHPHHPGAQQQQQQQQQGSGPSQQYADDYPRSAALAPSLESVPERPSSWSGQREEREGDRGEPGSSGREHHGERGGLTSKPRTPPELPTVSAVDAWRSGASIRGRQRATTDVGPHGSPSSSFGQAQLPPLRSHHSHSHTHTHTHMQQQQQHGEPQRQDTPSHEEHQHHHGRHARPSDEHSAQAGDESDRGAKRRRLSAGSG